MRKWYPWILVAGAAAFSLAVYHRLPSTVATHWDATGEVNGWSSRSFAALFAPALMVVMAVLLPRLPKIDPRRQNYEKFQGSYDLVVNGVITMLGVLHVAMLGVALGWPISMQRLAPVMVGGLLIVVGNVMPRARPNWLFGIRTPWTLSNDRVWERTHRVAGYLFVAAGAALLVSIAAPARLTTPLIISVVMIASVVPLVYSYFAWRQETSR